MIDLHSFSKSLTIIIWRDGEKIFERIFKNGPVTFGRTSKNDVTLDYTFVSRAHCHIYEKDGRFWLEDLKSSNGTMLLGKPVTVPCEVTDGFSFQIGVLQIKTELFHGQDDKTQVVTETSIPKLPEAVVPHSIAYTPPASPKKAPAPTPVVVHPPLPFIAKEKPHHKAIVSKNFAPDLLGHHAGTAKARHTCIEAVVMWHDQVYETREFDPKEKIVLGRGMFANLPLPLKKNWTLASLDFEKSNCYIPEGRNVSLLKDGKTHSMGDLVSNKSLKPKNGGYAMRFSTNEVVNVDMGSGIMVTLRYVPATRELAKVKLSEPEAAFKQSLIASGVLHFILALMMLIAAPKVENVPKLKNVPERFARLLVEKPKPKPTPTPKPPEKKVVEKKPEPRKQQVTRTKPPVITKLPKVLAKTNKFPMVVKNPIPKAPPPVKVESLGALGALGAISDKAPTAVTAININPNAGGMPTKTLNTGGIVGALPSSNGALVAAGGGRVKTKGMGYGTGTGYGIQGLKGTAGSRGVAGAIVGAPKLASVGKLEGLTRAQVMAVVQKYLGEVQHCYERNLLANPGLSGRMEFEWDISSGGSVTAVRVKRSTVSDGDHLGECIKGVFSSMKFPKASNGAATTPNIGFPFGRL